MGPKDNPGSPASVQSAPKRCFSRHPVRSGPILVGTAVLLLLSTIAMWRLARKPAESPMPPLEVVPLVALQGAQAGQGTPAFSADANQRPCAGVSRQNALGAYTSVMVAE